MDSSVIFKSCGVTLAETERAKAAEPVDVKFRGANFQVKEIMDLGCRRGDEYKNQLKRITQAESQVEQ